MNNIKSLKRIKSPSAMGIDSVNTVEIASTLVRICSPDVISDECGLLPIQFGGGNNNTPLIGMAKRLSTGRQSNGGNPREGEALPFRHPQQTVNENDNTAPTEAA